MSASDPAEATPDRRSLLHPSELVAAGVFVGTVAASVGVSVHIVWRWVRSPDGAAAAAEGAWDSPAARAAAVAVLAVGAVAFLWGRFVEPRLLRVTRLRLATGKLVPTRAGTGAPGDEGDGRLRLVFASDLHVEGVWKIGRKLVDRVRELRPDAVLLGGDYLNSKTRRSVETLERYVRELAEVAPVYAVLGNGECADPASPAGPDERAPSDAERLQGKVQATELPPGDRGEAVERGDPPAGGEPWHRLARAVLEDAGARVLPPGGGRENEAVEIGKGDARALLHGVPWLDSDEVARLAAELDRRRFNICLTHAAGLIPEASRAGFDLYLCGHTHGGQIRLPVYGAIVTLSVHGKRFEAGRYDVEGMTAYVTRGVGLECGPAPGVRFLCPPELVLVELAAARGPVARH